MLNLPEAPGAKAGRHCGIWAIVSTFLLCLPVALPLGIIAIVQNNKAKRLALATPDAFQVPSNAGIIMGIIALVLMPFLLILGGIVSAIAIPALLSQRARVREKMVVNTMHHGLAEMVAQYDRQHELGRSEAEIKAELENCVRAIAEGTKNPWNPAVPVFSYSVSVVSEQDEDGVREAAKSRVTELGQAVFVIQFPKPAQEGFVAGAVKIQPRPGGSEIYVKAVSL